MRPLDHFLAQIDRFESSPAQGQERRERLTEEFSRLVAPVLGIATAGELCQRALDRSGGRPQKIGALATFFLGEYDSLVPLDEEDWEDIRETLNDVSGEIDLNTLTSLMDDLLSRGKLG